MLAIIGVVQIVALFVLLGTAVVSALSCSDGGEENPDGGTNDAQPPDDSGGGDSYICDGGFSCDANPFKCDGSSSCDAHPFVCDGASLCDANPPPCDGGSFCDGSRPDEEIPDGGKPDEEIPDSGKDSGTDAEVDSGQDAGADAGVDASDGGVQDATEDGGPDAGIDSGADAGTDAGADASADGGTDGGWPPAKGVNFNAASFPGHIVDMSIVGGKLIAYGGSPPAVYSCDVSGIGAVACVTKAVLPAGNTAVTYQSTPFGYAIANVAPADDGKRIGIFKIDPNASSPEQAVIGRKTFDTLSFIFGGASLFSKLPSLFRTTGSPSTPFQGWFTHEPPPTIGGIGSRVAIDRSAVSFGRAVAKAAASNMNSAEIVFELYGAGGITAYPSLHVPTERFFMGVEEAVNEGATTGLLLSYANFDGDWADSRNPGLVTGTYTSAATTTTLTLSSADRAYVLAVNARKNSASGTSHAGIDIFDPEPADILRVSSIPSDKELVPLRRVSLDASGRKIFTLPTETVGGETVYGLRTTNLETKAVEGEISLAGKIDGTITNLVVDGVNACIADAWSEGGRILFSDLSSQAVRGGIGLPGPPTACSAIDNYLYCAYGAQDSTLAAFDLSQIEPKQ